MKYLISLLIPIICLMDNLGAEDDVHIFGSCNTLDFTNGQCVFLKDCVSLDPKHHKPNQFLMERIKLQQSQCGSYNNQPLVCCPELRKSRSLLPLPLFRQCGLQRTIPRTKRSVHTCVHDSTSQLNEHPWTVLLSYHDENFKCGGTLINPNYVITAAHCINHTNYGEIVSIRLGEWTNLTPCSYGYFVGIEEIVIHENYDKNLGNDIALIRLTRPVLFNNHIQPICLPSSTEFRIFNYEGVELIASGWTTVQQRDGYTFNKLFVNVEGINDEYCMEILNPLEMNSTYHHLCTGGREQIRASNGDLSGPLMAVDQIKNHSYWYLVGIVTEKYPGIYTRISDYVDWIESKVRP